MLNFLTNIKIEPWIERKSFRPLKIGQSFELLLLSMTSLFNPVAFDFISIDFSQNVCSFIRHSLHFFLLQLTTKRVMRCQVMSVDS